ncbi:MAG: hypothetical protein M9887_00610 [Chitinophagales bacterium]|nr:hypothetical protein [Chitinophagales bacterium]
MSINMMKYLKIIIKIYCVLILFLTGWNVYALTPDANGIIYVRTVGSGDSTGNSWVNATSNLQGAIDAAGVQKVFVAIGTYYPVNSGYVMKNGVAIYGGFNPSAGISTLADNRILPNPYNNNGTILSGNYQRPVVYNAFSQTSPLDTTALLDGFTITEGFNNSDAGGILNTYASPTLRNVTIKSNMGGFCGGVLNAFNSSPIFINCYIKGNLGGQVGGLYSMNASSPVLVNTEVSNNTSSYTGSNPQPGGIYQQGILGTIKLINCTVAANKPFGMKGSGASGTISNSIVYGMQGGTFTVSYSILDSTLYTYNGLSSATHINPFDLFIDSAQIFRLKAGAVAIDAGVDSLYDGLNANTKDLAGNPRLKGSAIDIGAFEYALIPNNGIIFVKPTATGFGAGNTWEHATGDLQSAINTPGVQQVYVAKGSYTTPGTGLVMKNGVAIYGGFDPDNGITTLSNNRILPGTGGDVGSILTGNNQHRVLWNGFNAANAMDSTAMLDGFTITGGYAPTGGAGITNNYASPTLRNLLITGNNGLGAVYLTNSAAKIINTAIVNNTGVGLQQTLPLATAPTLTNVTLANNSNGAVYNTSGTVTLRNTLAFGNITGAYTAFNSLVQNSADTTNGNISGVGIAVQQLFVNPSGGNYRLLYNAPVVNKGNNNYFTGLNAGTRDLFGGTRVYADTIDMGAYEFNITADANSIVYVKPAATGLADGSSWANATADIQGAINVAGTHKVFAAVGTYYRTEHSLIMKNNVEIYGGFDPDNGIVSLSDARIMPSPTNFSVGSILEANHIRPVIFNDFTAATALNSSAKIDGFTVAGGSASGNGGGIYNSYSSAVYNNLVIRDNWANSTGGGGGISIENYSNPTISNSYIIRNQGWYTSAVWIDMYSSPVLTNVEITKNTMTGNQGLYISTVIFASLSDITMTNCTVAANEPDTWGALILNVHTNGYYAHLKNCIISGGISASIDAKSCLIQTGSGQFDSYNAGGNATGLGALTYEQIFSDPANGIFRLRYGSPAVNAGSNSFFPGLNANSTDLDGLPRVTDGTIDMGAHEYKVSSGANGIVYVKTNETGLGDGSSWANATANLQGAIDAAGTQKVFVAKGTYKVPSPNSFVMKNGVKIYGGFDPANGISSLNDNRIMPALGNQGSILDGNNERPVIWNYLTAATAMDTSAVLDGFTLKNATGSANEGCIHNRYASPTLSNLLITGNGNTGLYNIMSSPPVTNTAIVGNAGRGLYQTGGRIALRNVTIAGNASNAIAMTPFDANNPGQITLSNSVLFGTVSGLNGNNIISLYSFIENNALPDFGGNADATGWNVGNVFADTATKNYSLRWNVPAINSGYNSIFPNLTTAAKDIMGLPRVTDTTIDMGAYEFMLNPNAQPIMYVKPASTGTGMGDSWANATHKLQRAIDASGTQQVWVAKGNYNIPSPDNSFVMKNGVKIYGGFDPDNGIVNLGNNRIMPDTSGIIGSVLNGMNLKPVVWNVFTAADSLDSTAVLDGFTLTNGNSPSDGGGMNNRYASPTLRNLVFKNNTANYGGGIFNRYSTVKMENIVLQNNTANINGGGIYNNIGNPVLTNISLNNNTAVNGGGMYNDNVSATMSEVTATNNTASGSGGMVYNNNATLSLSKLTATNNTASGSGGMAYNNNAVFSISTATATGNTAGSQGGGMYNTGGSVNLYALLFKNNNAGGIVNMNTPTIITNSAIISNPNGGLKQSDDTVKLVNSTIAGNTVYGLDISTGQSELKNTILYGLNGANYTAYNSLVEGSADTTNSNVNATGITPALIFVNPAGGDYKLKMPGAHPLISTGNNSFFGYPTSSLDVSGGQRFIGNNIDMGAYEYSPVADSNAIVYVKVAATGLGDGSSWANATDQLQDAIDANGTQQVWVAKGTYYGNFWLKPYISLYGGFDPDNGISTLNDNRIMMDTVNNTGSVLDGTNSGTTLQTVKNTVTDGFTIQHGSSDKGGGIYNYNTGSYDVLYDTLRNLVVRDNQATDGGGIYNRANHAILENIILKNNVAVSGGGMYNTGAQYYPTTMTNIIITNNSATDGGGIFNVGTGDLSWPNGIGGNNLIMNEVSLLNNAASHFGGGLLNGGIGYRLYTNAEIRANYIMNNVKIQGNSAGEQGGGIYHNTGEGVITNGLITDNTCDSMGSAVFIRTNYLTANNTTFANNVCNNPSPTFNTDLYIESFLENMIEMDMPELFNQDHYVQLPEMYVNNSIVFAKANPYHSYRPKHSLLKDLIIFDYLSDTLGNIKADNMEVEDVFTDPANGDYTLRTSSPAINKGADSLFPNFNSNTSTDLAGNLRKIGSAIDMGAYELPIVITPDANGIAYVKPDATGTKDGSSWANATDNIPEAIQGTGTQQVWVAKGNYPVRGVGFAMKNGVKIYGGFAPDSGIVTLADHRIMPGELSNSPFFGGGQGEAGSVLDGRNRQPIILNLFKDTTAIDTTARLDGFTLANGNYDFGSGIQNKYASPTLSNLVVKNCVAQYDGGGIYNDVNCNPIMSNMVISGNSGNYGGGMFNKSASLQMTNIAIIHNTSDNDGGGMYNDASAAPSLTNVAITQNTAVSGAGMFNRNSSPTLLNTTITGNIPDAIAGSNGGASSVANSIVFGSVTASYSAQYSLIEGNAGGSNGNLNGQNITANDVFTDTATGDYTLKTNSPVIDMGDNALFAGLDTSTKDLAGNLRLQEGTVDLGAYEFQSSSVLPITLLSFTVEKDKATALLTWTTVSEQNNQGFEIERSTDAKNWYKIGYQPSKSENGNSWQPLTYRFTDMQPEEGIDYYRFKQIDFDGKTEYSPIRYVIFDEQRDIKIYPNPAKEQISISGLQGGETLLLIDELGRMIRTIHSENKVETVSVSDLISGSYYILIQSKSGSRYSLKLVIRQ